MSYLILGFITGMSLILALGPQNIFVIEQGLKKEFIFTVCLICTLSDFLLIFLGIFIFHYFQHFFTPFIEFILNGSIYNTESPYNSFITGISEAITGHLQDIASRGGIPNPS